MRMLSLVGLILCIVLQPVRAQTAFDSLAITTHATSREFSFTNKQDAFVCGETGRQSQRSWQGFIVAARKYLDDYELRIDGRLLDRHNAFVTVFPDYLRRVYPGGVVEEFRMPDSLPLLAISVSSPGRPAAVELVPWISEARSANDFLLMDNGRAVTIARRHSATSPAHADSTLLVLWSSAGTVNKNFQSENHKVSPASVTDPSAESHLFVIIAGTSGPAAEELARRYVANPRQFQQERRSRMEQLLRSTRIQTDDPRFNKAIAWATLSLDALMMHDRTDGIYAGLPWFNNYWGRDTFVALPGAALVTGRFNEAKKILRSFSLYQKTDTSSFDFGKIPNIVTRSDTAFNTADGTPRFIIMAREYVERSGDSAFAQEIYPVVVRATDGTIRHHTDSLAFLTHGDADTWMDAAGPDGAWSPRGNRANDIQALWIGQLEAASWFAERSGDSAHASAWRHVRNRCQENLQRYFIDRDGHRIADRLRRDNVPDYTLRPNMLFLAPCLDSLSRAAMVRTVTTKLTYEYGVASLSQDDDNFHPYHQYEPFYPKDAAYHNGTVWTWLQGPLISELCRFGHARTAYRLTRNTVHQMLDRGAVGTISELLDAVPHPREPEPRLSGTFSQAWSLGEFVRNVFDDYLGVRLDRYHKTMTIQPHLPPVLGIADAVINADGNHIDLHIDLRPGRKMITLVTGEFPDTLKAIVELPSGEGSNQRAIVTLPPHATVSLAFSARGIRALRNGSVFAVSAREVTTPPDTLLDPLAFAAPTIRRGLKAMRGPDYPLLSNGTIKAENPSARLLVDQADSLGDDTVRFSYPTNPSFLPGSFDLTRFIVRYDSLSAYFTLKLRALSDPGWHPDYGFQLTYLAIAISQDSAGGAGRRYVPANAGYVLPKDRGYQRIVFVGGGVSVEDTARHVLAAYAPAPGDEAHPLGDAQHGVISFAIPLKYLGTPNPAWVFTVLAGAQDDHGGAGIGEFRTINAVAGEWNGGGKTAADSSNVYDVLDAHTVTP